MRMTAHRRTAIAAGLAAGALIAAGCGTSDDGTSVDGTAPATSVAGAPTTERATGSAAAQPTEVTIVGERDVEVTLTGPIAEKFSSATPEQKQALGLPLTGDHNAGARESGLLFQQFAGGVITAKSAEPGTPAYITWGKIRDAWNVDRAADGTPDVGGDNGSVGPLGAPTSDETADGDLLTTTFDNGTVTFNTVTEEVEVTINGQVVPSGL